MSTQHQRAAHCCCWIWLAFLTCLQLRCTETRSNSVIQEVEQPLPDCGAYTVCGYVQLNVQGVSVQPLCRCRRTTCPMVWDPLDGRTIAHGNDQYKYCERAPRLELCTTKQVVHSSYIEVVDLTGEMLVNKVRVHCLCPPTYLFTRNHTFLDLNGITGISVTSYCKPPPSCGRHDACMGITKSYDTSTSFVTRNCACPFGLYCPSEIRLASNRIDLNKGVYYVMQCL